MMWRYMGLGWGWGGSIMMILFWLLIIGVVVFLVREWRRHEQECGHDRGREEGGALETLRNRYARGEITREEFTEMWETLKSRSR